MDSGKILIFIPSSYYGGAEKRLVNIAYYLVKSGCNVFLGISNTAYTSGLNDKILNERLLFISNEGKLLLFNNYLEGKHVILYKFYSLIKLISMVVRVRPKILHTVLWSYFVLPVFAFTKIKIVYEIVGAISLKNVLGYSHFFSNRVHAYNVISLTVYDRFIKEYKGRKLLNKLNVSDIPFYIPSSNTYQDYTKENIIIYCAKRFTKNKNPILFIEASAQVLLKHSDFKIVMMGDGPLKKEVEQIVRSFGLEKRVEIFKSDNVGSIFAKTKIYVGVIEPDNVPSQAAMEALEYGNIMVMSKTGRSGIFASNNNGFMSDLGVEELVKEIEKAIAITKNPQDFCLYSKRSYELLNLQFPPLKYIERIRDMYSSIIDD